MHCLSESEARSTETASVSECREKDYRQAVRTLTFARCDLVEPDALDVRQRQGFEPSTCPNGVDELVVLRFAPQFDVERRDEVPDRLARATKQSDERRELFRMEELDGSFWLDQSALSDRSPSAADERERFELNPAAPSCERVGRVGRLRGGEEDHMP